MTWNTPYGLRILEGSERRLVDNVIYDMAMEILEADEDDDLQLGVPAFDSLTPWQQLVVLDTTRSYLFVVTPDSQPDSPAMNASIVTIFAFVLQCVETELEARSKLKSKAQRLLFRKWRMLVYKACKSRQWEFDPRSDATQWKRAIDFLRSELLSDTDVAESLGPIAEPTGPEMLAIVRRLIGST